MIGITWAVCYDPAKLTYTLCPISRAEREGLKPISKHLSQPSAAAALLDYVSVVSPDGPSEMYQRGRSCTVKAAYATMEIATNQAKATAARTKLPKGFEYAAYACKWCQLFHVGRRKVAQDI